jgi:opacity protein-like surface antigen
MKKTFLSIFIFSAVTLLQAQQNFDIGYTFGSAKSYSLSAKPSVLRFVYGYEFNKNLAGELLLGTGLAGGQLKIDGDDYFDVKYKIKNAYGLYLTPKFDFNEQFSTFIRVGWAAGKADVSSSIGQETVNLDSENSFSYGVGLAYSVNPKTSIKLDYMSYLSKNSLDITGLTLSVGFKF